MARESICLESPHSADEAFGAVLSARSAPPAMIQIAARYGRREGGSAEKLDGVGQRARYGVARRKRMMLRVSLSGIQFGIFRHGVTTSA